MRLLRVTMALLLFSVMTLSAGAAPVGMVCHMTGQPQMRSGAAGAWQPARLLQKLDAGDALRCGPGAEAVVVLFAGGQRFQVGAGADAVVGANSVQGARSLGALDGPSSRVAATLGGSRAAAVLARPAQSHERLTPTSPGWHLASERVFSWPPLANADAYTFTLFDGNDNVVWSARVSEASAAYPDDLPALAQKRPYVWRLVPFGRSGKPLPEARWGILAFLTQADADRLSADAQELQRQDQANPQDVTALLLLAELYRSYGVLEKTLETLEDLRLKDEPGITQALDETYGQVSAYARTLAHPPDTEEH